MNKQKCKLSWYEIEYLYPLAFTYFKEKMFPNTGLVSIQLLNFYETRRLYGFFDREGIYLNTEIIGGMQQWSSTIWFNNGTTISNSQTFSTRDEVEADGFMRCFEHLEHILQTKIVG